MSDRAGVTPSVATHASYSPKRRTALVLSGIGTEGAYHAGVLRALHEAGVKLDIVAGRGVGVIGALFAAVDGAERLWHDQGFWRAPGVQSLYAWRTVPRVLLWSLGIALALVALPVAAVALGLIVFPIDFVLKMVGIGAAAGLVGAYTRLAERAFAPDALPTWLPRLALLTLGCAGVTALVHGWTRRAGPGRGAFWWRAVGPPLSSSTAADRCWGVMWDLVRGAASLKAPSSAELGRRYAELLTDNLGQPGFRELLIAVHDVDAHRDLVCALVGEDRRAALTRRPTAEAADGRRAEVLDLAGVARDLLPDAVVGALTVPLATDWHALTFAAEGYWRGETHRVCDRPGSLIRLVDELIELDVEQIILVSAAPESPGPHALVRPRLDGRGRLGEYLQSAEAAVVRDVTTTTGGVRIFVVRPVHNAIGPFDFAGAHDDLSHRRQGLGELMNRGYEDAYHQFIEPVVGASGDGVGLKSAIQSEV